MAVSDHNLIWVDMEMTGLVPEEHRVIEIATIVTDTDLNVLAEGPVIAVHQSPHTLQAMDEWNTRTHTNSGLVERVRGSAVSEEEATHLTLAFLERWVPATADGGIPFARIVASWRVTCQHSSGFFITGIWMSVP